MLSSEILEKQFGPTRLVILKQNPKQRIIETITEDGKQILELSQVIFDQKNSHAYPEVHKKIVAGSSMGKAYKEAGVKFTRKTQSITHVELPPILEAEFNEKGLGTIIEVDIFVGKQALHYCHIIEIYSPIVVW